ncbi:MAG: hypothetical protein R3B95_10220 [Nitrospirales bacterium]|nr:hypothetical protein [Nitrospirales bacterium]
MQATHGVSSAQGYAALKFARSAYYQVPVDWHVRDQAIIAVLNAFVEAHPRWGVWKYIRRLRALGHGWNHKRMYRIYRQ